jgi:hypothetical protein
MSMLKRSNRNKTSCIYLILIFLISAISVFSIKAQTFNGKYEYETKESSGEILIKEITKTDQIKSIKFEIKVGRDGGENLFGFCIGELEGEAKEIAPNIFEYNTELNERDEHTNEVIICRITFSFSKEVLIVRESNCGYFHGVACNFEGKFTRLKKTKTKKRKS